jgi:hypothetical protein
MPDGSSPQEPEAPEAIIWVRWAAHHLFREGAVIRKAPLATLVMAVAMFFASQWFVHMQDDGKIAGLNGVIDTKNAEVQFLDDRLQAYETKSPDAASTARARFKYVSIGRAADQFGKYVWTVFFQNVGNGSAIGPVHEGFAEISDKLIVQPEIEAVFSKLYTALDRDKKLVTTSEYQPQDTLFVSFLSDIDGKRIDPEVVKGTKFLYTFALIAYRDSDTPPGKYRITEVCGFTTGGGVQVNCDTHNRIFLSN